MGKNQAYKAMQRAKMASHTAAGGVDEVDDGMMDGSFHSPEWHAARLASLQTSHTVTWEEWKQKQKEEAKRQGELEDDEARLMKEYRAQLDAERASKLARGKNHTGRRESLGRGPGKKDKEKEREKQKEREKSRLGKKKKKSSKRHRSRSDSESDMDSTSSEDDKDTARKERRKLRRDRREKKQKTRRKQSSSDSQSEDGADGPVPLSFYFENGKE